MGVLYVDTGGNALNSGSRDTALPLLSGSAATVSGTTVTLDGSPDLSGLNTSGANQDSILISQASNANMKIFWITGFDNTAKTITVHAAPTGVTSSAWRIGGQHALTNASIEGALRAGDTILFNNSPASGTGTRWTFRNAGTSAAGPAKILGKTGVRPQLITTNAANVVVCAGGGLTGCWMENFELIQQGASQDVVGSIGAAFTMKNCKISDGGANGIELGSASGIRIIGCEFSGLTGSGISGGPQAGEIIGNYVHDVGGAGFNCTTSTPNISVLFNIFDTCGTNGFAWNTSGPSNPNHHVNFSYNTIYFCGADGIIIGDVDCNIVIANNIVKDNGNTGTEYNINLSAGVEPWVLGYNNVFNISGGRGGGNANNYTLASTDLTSDPLFTNADAGDFSLQNGSPAIAAGFPGQFLGGNLSYLDIGAVQKQAGGGRTGVPLSRLVGAI